MKDKINNPHERVLRIIYTVYASSFEGLLNKDNSFPIYVINIQSLDIDTCKFLNRLSPTFLNNMFHKNSSKTCAIQNRLKLYSRNPKTVRYGTKTVLYMAHKLCSNIPEIIKMSSSFEFLNQK